MVYGNGRAPLNCNRVIQLCYLATFQRSDILFNLAYTICKPHIRNPDTRLCSPAFVLSDWSLRGAVIPLSLIGNITF